MKFEFYLTFFIWSIFENLVLGVKLITEEDYTLLWKFLITNLRDLSLIIIYCIFTYLRFRMKKYKAIFDFQKFMSLNFCLIILNQYLKDNYERERVFLEFYEEYTIFKLEFNELSNVNFYEMRSNAYNFFQYYYKNEIKAAQDLTKFFSIKPSLFREGSSLLKKNSLPALPVATIEQVSELSEIYSDKEYSIAQHNYIDFPDNIKSEIDNIARKFFCSDDEKVETHKQELRNMFDESFAYVNKRVEELHNLMINDRELKFKIESIILFCDCFEMKFEIFEIVF